VQKYVGSSKTKPKLAKIGGKLWLRQKKAVQEAVFDLAAEMIDLQAARSTLPGIAFPPDSDWQESFDAAFPYQETPDQLLAIDAIKNDMMKPQPMDRLLCGDVGFGKTEVALRGVFKAVDAGYQVAILVPTTVLAQQHFRTISERMSEFPFTIAAMTRFQSKREQAETREKLAFGSVDIVVGTHGLASENIHFHNLGLVIIDEEQRFGVEHKERLKTLRKMVDVLTMTATPIPRTLHFSLLGIRDISNLETPPPDRMPVETKLVRFQPELIRSAILREINRGGQVFFVHNKVSDIESVAAKIQRIVPEARIAIGHAQMPDEALEQVMIDFIDYKFDVFVSTTIVESGLDIPNANTIFIDAADHFGLAELHQLRGRVGRYKHQAYCYLLLDANQSLNENAGKRLRAIEEFSHLGAGFNIAMRDLEIRGAGNILGTQQSGHIAAVGYELYCSFLEAAVRALKRMPQKTVVEVEVELPGSAYIPKSYITVQKQKIDLYRRLSRVTTVSDVKDLENEMIDRFGKPPHVTQRLLKLAAIRVKAHLWRVRFIHVERGMMGDPNVSLNSGYVVMEFVSYDLMNKLKRALYPIPLRITNDMKAYCPFPKEIGSITGSPDEILKFVDDILSPIPR
jgi:transcription-repair coupling factor (superfamily II helicase)